MNNVVVEVIGEKVRKYSTDLLGYQRVVRELEVFKYLQGSRFIPQPIKSSDNGKEASIYMETIQGQSLKQLLGMQDEYLVKPRRWGEAKKFLDKYVAAEMDLLSRGALYRDMNLDHLIFTGNKAVFIDLESTLINPRQHAWLLNDMRGTWETMAPEEFPGYGQLSARTATYRVAAVAYLMLVGRLPFRRFPYSRSATYRWRLKHGPEVDMGLSKETQRVFKIALARKQIHRHKDPAIFFERLNKSYLTSE